MEMTRHVQSTQNRKLVTFYKKYYEESITTAFVFCCDAKHLDILWGPVVFVGTCFLYIFPLTCY